MNERSVPRFVHFSDVHLDTSFAASRPLAQANSWRRMDLRATVSRILSAAREWRVDAITIAGDLYEQEYTLPDTAHFLSQQFAKVAPIRVYITPGESDPFTSDSLYALTRWPENVTIFTQGRLSAVELVPAIHLWGAACPPGRGHKSLDKFHVDQDGVNVLLLHGDARELAGSSGEDLFEVDSVSVRSAGFDFALLGHCHTARMWPEDNPCCAYPGSPEPLTAEEAGGAHTVVLLTIEDGICKPELIPVSQWRYSSLPIDLSGCESTDQAATRVSATMRAMPGGDDERLMCEVSLVGRPEFDVDLSALANLVSTQAHVSYEVRFSPRYDLEHLAEEQTVRGLLVRRFQSGLKAAKNREEYILAEDALLCALRALDGKQVVPDEIP